MKRTVTLAIGLALALPVISAQKQRFKAAPAMLDGGFAVPAQQQAGSLYDAPDVVAVIGQSRNYGAAPAATQGHGFKRKAAKIGRIVRASIPYMYAAYMGEQDWYWLQHALEPFPVPKKPR